MIKKVILVILIVGLIGFAVAQVGQIPQLPSAFTISLTPLPQQQSEGQRFFNCPYGIIEHRVTNIYTTHGTQLSPIINAEVKYWVLDGEGNRICAASVGRNWTTAASLTSNELINNFNDAINQYFQAEALNNNQLYTTPTPIAVGS